MGNPCTVSVIIPLFNAERWIAETIASVRVQSLHDWELIVVDDGSTDGGPQLVGAQARRDPRIRLVCQQNLGPSVARNRGAAESTAPWISFLDADDLMQPDRLASDIATSVKAPSSRVIAAANEWFDEPNRILHSCLLDRNPEVNLWRHCFHSVYYFSALLIHRDAFIKCGGFSGDPNVFNAEDYDLTLRLIEREELAQREGIAVRNRKHTSNRSAIYDQRVTAQTVELVRQLWSRRLGNVSTTTAERMFRFWRMEPAKLAVGELAGIIETHGAFAKAHLSSRPQALRTVRLDWERRLALRIVEAGLSRRQFINLARLESKQRGGFAAVRLMLRYSRLHKL